MQGLSSPSKITNGFILSVVAGVLVLLNGVFWFILGHGIMIPRALALEDPLSTQRTLMTFAFVILGSIGILFAIGIFIGATFIYLHGYNSTGGKIVIAFSILSIATGGGLFIGMIIGIVGGALALQKK